MARHTLIPVLVCLIAGAGACAEFDPVDAPHTPDGPQTGSNTSSIVGGSFDALDNAVVALFVGGGLCTGTLIAPNVVLTAAHCVSDAIEAGQTSSGSVTFGNGMDASIETIGVIDMAMHRLYDPPAFLQWDIAMVRLQHDAPESINPIPMRLDPLSQDDLGSAVRVVGFGVSDGVKQTGSGIKRQVTLTLDEISYLHIGLGTSTQNSCQGDSGGPTFGNFGSGEEIIGVTSFGSDACRDRSYMTRVDSMQDWAQQVLGSWSGPCMDDQECVTTGCGGIIDPDCGDICAFEGFCGQDCEAIDLDCPSGNRAGELCEDKYDCESRNCEVAPDEDRLSYCSSECDPARPLETCPSPLSSCIERDGGYFCAFAGPTPSAQGSSCTDGKDCRSGVCDSRGDICVEQCGDGLPECSEPYSCQNIGGAEACRLESDSGSCAAVNPVGSGATGFLSLLSFLGLTLLLGRSRNRRQARVAN